MTLTSQVCCEQALSQKEAEKAALTEKIAALQQDLATAGMELERMQREALSKHEQDKVNYGRVTLAPVTFLVLYMTYITQLTDFCTSMFQDAMAVLQSELHDLRTQFEESLNSHENVKKSLTEQVRELNQQREHAQQEVRTFKNQTSFFQPFFLI